MKKESIDRFFRAVMTEKALAEKVAAMAGEQGYDFTAEELLEFGSARPLSDDDVENASGGKRGYSMIDAINERDAKLIIM